MIDIHTYIESGIVSDYVLGLATEEQAAELERYMLEYPQLKAEVLAEQEALESYALQYETVPPPALKGKIWHQISTTLSKPNEGAPQNLQNKNVRAIRKRGDAYFKAACLAAILALALTSVFFFSKWRNAQKQQIAAIDTIQNQLANSRQQQDKLAKAVDIMADPATKMISLNGVPKYKDYTAKVFWDKEQHAVYLAPGKLPNPPSGQQYQLWGIVNGKPVDAGMLAKNATELQTMKAMANVQAFAITLEPEGGSAAPTMDQMVAMGKMSDG